MEGEFDEIDESGFLGDEEFDPKDAASDDGFGRPTPSKDPSDTASLYSSGKSSSNPQSAGISPDDILLSNRWSSLLETVQTMALPKRALVQPWERGFAALVFGTSSSSTSNPTRLPFVPIPAPTVQAIPTTNPQGKRLLNPHDRPGAWPVVSGRIAGLSWDDGKELNRSRALNRLREFFQHNPESSGLGRTLMNDILALQSENYLNEVVSNVFAKKATATLEKRARSLTNYALFCKLRNNLPVPVIESMVYHYMSVECLNSSSKAQQLSEALNFSAETLQIDGAREATASPRIKGFCFKQLLTKKPLKQADVLTVEMVMSLEYLINTDADFLPDRIFAGNCLACVHGRFRWSDGQSILSAA